MSDLPPMARVQAELYEMTTVGESNATLERMGIKVYRIPTGWMEAVPPNILQELGTDKKIFLPADHADMHVMYLPTERGLFFSESYYREHQDLLDRIVAEIRPEIFGTLPDEDGLPINSLPLPNGGVYIDKAARQAIKIIRQAGIRVETTSQPFGTWAWGTWGGIHCSTNLINLPSS